MKFFKKLFGGKKYEAEQEFARSFERAFKDAEKETGTEIRVSMDQFLKLQDFNRHRTPEEKAALAAELAFQLQKAEEMQDINLYKDVESQANAYLKEYSFLYRQATKIKEAEPEISKEALALRVLEWSKQQGHL